jgi:integrase
MLVSVGSTPNHELRLPDIFPLAHKRIGDKDEERHHLRLAKAFGSKQFDAITRREIQAFHVFLRNDGMSPAYVSHFIKLLRRCLNLAVNWDILEMNPAVRISLVNQDTKVEHYLDDDKLERLLKVLKADDKRNLTVLMIALFLLSTGERLNDALQAKSKDIDRENRVWRVPAVTSNSKQVRAVLHNDSTIEVGLAGH